MDSLTAHRALTNHRHYRYRGCAPTPADVADFPGQSLGDPALPVSAWDRPEDAAQQQAALAVCGACPVRAECRTAALLSTGGKSAGPNAVRGGLVGGMVPAVHALLDGPGIDSEDARQQLVEHRRYRYRGCALSPEPDFPGQSLGDPALSVDAWGTLDLPDGRTEPQPDRLARERAAIGACASCPVLAECQAYAMSVTPDGRLAEQAGIWGGIRSLDRHRALIQRRQAASVTIPAAEVSESVLSVARTAQKQAVLRALAREVDEELVAYRSGMDVRTANWHRAILCGLLGLDKDTASREQLLTTAQRLGILPERVLIRPDGRWPVAAAPNGDGSRQRRIAPGMPVQAVLPGYQHLPRTRRRSLVPASVLAATRRARRGPRLRLVIPPPQQLLLPLPVLAVLEPAA
ncbi:WhiB family transcriptional regulator [Streptomyces sp. NPDC059679]|uniref:WhiB family transcriptional regulator n=1 Tax=Streptomyces sp. NPDC059679 TaxID=3346903 RepID=UPI0036C40B9A